MKFATRALNSHFKNQKSNIGFKEWALVCEALGRGKQSIILRKGGIAEGRDGFRFKHDEFFLFPTWFHEQLAKTTLPPETVLPAQRNGIIGIKYFVRVEWTAFIDDADTAAALAPFHIWRQSVIDERFRYDEPPGLSLAFVRVFQLASPWIFPDAPAYGGCRSWLKLPQPATEMKFTPVLDDSAHAARDAQLRAIVKLARDEAVPS